MGAVVESVIGYYFVGRSSGGGGIIGHKELREAQYNYQDIF